MKLTQIKHFDAINFGSSVLLLLLGLLMIYSTTLESTGNLLPRQMIFAVLGLIGMFLLAFSDYRDLKKLTPWLYLLIILALGYVLFFGSAIRGSSRWVNLGFFQLQPAELAKLFMVIVMAKFLDKHGEKLKDFRYVLLSAVYIGIPALLILAEPDLGSALVLAGTWFAMLLFSPMKKKHLAILIAILILGLVVGWFFVMQDYQRQRVFTFINPDADPKGSGYNVIQSIIAVGSGGLWGRGLGRGFQSQLKFLPERQTDFIFASTAEELGLLGSLAVIGLFCLLFYRLVKTIKTSRDNFGMFLALGIFFMFFIQVLINIGMNIGILPVTGIPLPLLSYGGSSLLTTFLALGVIQSIVRHRKALKFGG